MRLTVCEIKSAVFAPQYCPNCLDELSPLDSEGAQGRNPLVKTVDNKQIHRSEPWTNTSSWWGSGVNRSSWYSLKYKVAGFVIYQSQN